MASKLLSTFNLNEDSSAKTHGSCLCGKVKYTITGQPGTKVLCHCNSCKKSTGSSFMANEFYQRKVTSTVSFTKFYWYNEQQVEIQDPTASLKTYADTSPDAGVIIDRSFCGNCGSNLVVTNRKHPEAMIVTSGTLDDEKILQEWQPKVEFYCKRRNQWLQGVGADEGSKFNAMIWFWACGISLRGLFFSVAEGERRCCESWSFIFMVYWCLINLASKAMGRVFSEVICFRTKYFSTEDKTCPECSNMPKVPIFEVLIC